MRWGIIVVLIIIVTLLVGGYDLMRTQQTESVKDNTVTYETRISNAGKPITYTKEYNNAAQRLVISDDKGVTTDIQMLTPKINKVPLGNNIIFAEFNLYELSTSKTALMELMNFYDLGDNNKEFLKTYTVNYYNYSIINMSDKDGERYEERGWIPIAQLNQVPSFNTTHPLRIGLSAKFTTVGQRIEWVPTIDGFSITEWATVEVSRGEIYQASGEEETYVDLGKSYNQSNTFIMTSSRTTSSQGASGTAIIRFYNDSFLLMQRYANTNGDYRGFYELVTDTSFSVQHKLVSYPNSNLNLGVEIDAVDVNKTFVLGQCRTSITNSVWIAYCGTKITLENTTGVSLIRLLSSNVEVLLQVVSMTEGNVYRGEYTFDNTMDEHTFALPSSINTSASFMFHNQEVNSTDRLIEYYYLQDIILNSTHVQLKRGLTGGSNGLIAQYILVENPRFLTNVYEGTLISTSETNITLSPSVNLTNTFLSGSQLHNYTSSVIGAVRQSVDLVDSTTITIDDSSGSGSVYGYGRVYTISITGESGGGEEGNTTSCIIYYPGTDEYFIPTNCNCYYDSDEIIMNVSKFSCATV